MVITFLHPNIAETVKRQQGNQRKYHDGANQKLREFNEHDPIQVKNSMEELRNGNRVLWLKDWDQ